MRDRFESGPSAPPPALAAGQEDPESREHGATAPRGALEASGRLVLKTEGNLLSARALQPQSMVRVGDARANEVSGRRAQGERAPRS